MIFFQLIITFFFHRNPERVKQVLFRLPQDYNEEVRSVSGGRVGARAYRGGGGAVPGATEGTRHRVGPDSCRQRQDSGQPEGVLLYL